MHIAIGKNGRIGRKTRSMGETVEVAAAPVVDQHMNVMVDYNTLQSNAAYIKKQEEIHKAQVEEGIKKARAEAAERAKEARALEISALLQQQQKAIHPLQDALKSYFAQQLTQSETERVVRSIKADFFDNEMIPDYQEGVKAGVRSADFNIRNVVGNPLVRDGKYGVVTDYDRLVQGLELDNDAVQIVGGTMVRRLPARGERAQMGESDRNYTSWDETSHTSDDDLMVTTMQPIRHEMETTTSVPAETAPAKTVIEILSNSQTSGKLTIRVIAPNGESENGEIDAAHIEALKKSDQYEVIDKRVMAPGKIGKYAMIGAAALGIFFLVKE